MKPVKPYDCVVFIGRFQPVHNAHVAILRRAYELADKVVVVVGSANQPRTVDNPFNVSERMNLVRQAFDRIAPPEHLNVVAVEDNMYNNTAWAVTVQQAVSTCIYGDVAIIGHKKDETSFYLDMFPQWAFVEQEEVEPLHAASVREQYFSRHANLNFLTGVVPATTLNFLERFQKTDDYANIVEEKEFNDKYKKQFENYPFPPTFVTSDAVVIQSGHVLMVKRRHRPGKGLLAFPGGFLNAGTDRSMEDCMIRELYEETKLKVPEPVVRGSIVEVKVFDGIKRSARGRTITHAFKIVFRDGEWALPKVKGSDDADPVGTGWYPISKVTREMCFEDHYSILQYFLGKGN